MLFVWWLCSGTFGHVRQFKTSKLNHVCLTQVSETWNFMQNSRLQGGFLWGNLWQLHCILLQTCWFSGKTFPKLFQFNMLVAHTRIHPCSTWDFRPGVYQRRVLLHGTTRSVFAGCHASRAENHGSKDNHAPPVGTSGKGDWSARLLIKGKGVVFFWWGGSEVWVLGNSEKRWNRHVCLKPQLRSTTAWSFLW